MQSPSGIRDSGWMEGEFDNEEHFNNLGKEVRHFEVRAFFMSSFILDRSFGKE